MAQYIDHPTKRYHDGTPVLVLADKGQFIETDILTQDQAKRHRRSMRFHGRLGQRPLSLWPKHLGSKTQRFSFASSGKGE